MAGTPGALPIKTMTGYPVKNAQGAALGNLVEVLLEHATGRVAYAVISFGGVAGLGGKLIGIPWDRLKLNYGDASFRLEIDRALLDRAPPLDRQNYPGAPDLGWLEHSPHPEQA